jgi:hypothetical protein
MLSHGSLFKVAAIIKKIPLQSRLNYLGFCNYLGLHKAEIKLICYSLITISYLFKRPAIPDLENFAFFIRLLSGSME